MVIHKRCVLWYSGLGGWGTAQRLLMPASNSNCIRLDRPKPRLKRILTTSAFDLQGVLTGEPKIVELAASLMEVIITYNPPAMARLYSSGAFYFALAYAGANLRTIASLFKKAHLHQAFHG